MRKPLSTAAPAPQPVLLAYRVDEVGVAWVAGLAIWTIAMMAMMLVG
jgi:hypothetical protein